MDLLEDSKMRRKGRQVSFVFFTIVLLVSFICAPKTYCASQKSFLWKVRSPSATVYLLGSVHFMRREIYPLPREIEEAFDQSNVLVVEANVTDIGKLDLEKLTEKAFYPEDDGLVKHVSSSTYELIKKETAKFGLPLEIVNRQRPWLLSLTLEALELIGLGMDPSYGIDYHFLSKAEGKKKILELESFDYQIDLLSGLSGDDQELLILYTLKDFSKIRPKVDQLIKAWKSGDEEGMQSIATSETREDWRFSSIYEKIVSDRNRSMAGKIEEFLRTGETYFVVAGVAHLIGEKGIVELLRGRGYPVEGVLVSR